MNRFFLYLKAALYFFAGINHFLSPGFYMTIMPLWVPWKIEMIYFTGVLEMLFSILLVIGRTRKWAAWGIVILLIAIFPANIQMLLNNLDGGNKMLWISILRLPLQILLIWWALIYTKKTSD